MTTSSSALDLDLDLDLNDTVRCQRNKRARIAVGWARALGSTFRRVALFEIEGTEAKVTAVQGMGPPPGGAGLSLLDATPLRWAVEAASPIIGAGAAPGGATIAAVLGLSTPRAFAVVPLIIEGSLTALAYVDQAGSPLPISAASELFAFVGRLLREPGNTRLPGNLRSAYRSTSSRPDSRQVRPPRFEPLRHVSRPPPLSDVEPDAPGVGFLAPYVGQPLSTPDLESEQCPTPAPIPIDAVDESAIDDRIGVNVSGGIARTVASEPLDAGGTSTQPNEMHHEPCSSGTGTREPDPFAAGEVTRAALAAGSLVVTPDGILVGHAGAATPAAGAKPWRRWTALAAIAVASLVGLVLVPMAPVGDDSDNDNERVINIPRQASVAGIAQYLEHERIIRSAFMFKVASRITGIDRDLRAGVYRLPTHAWMWTVLAQLHRGQVKTRTVTIPEGLTLSEIAALLEQHGLARATDILREARDPELREHFGIPGETLEGYLFPETYTMAQGLTAREVLTVMVEEFYTRLAEIPEAAGISPDDLMSRVTLASIVEREARDKSELTRVSGVFHNRLKQNIRLESCATVQYVLGKPKARLTVRDVRRPSPYNTYLHTGLPPGPIASPGLPALRSVFEPEEHNYLFFFARQDGSHRHVFSRTYEAHQAKQRKLRRR